MIWKKSVWSYFVWAMYLIAGTGALTYFGYSLTEGRQVMEWLPEVLAGALLWAGILLVLVISALIARRRAGVSERKDNGRCRIGKLILEVLVFALILAVGLLIRVWYLEYAGDGTTYYDVAKVTDGSGLPQIAHGATYFYIYLLRMVFTLVGNRWIAGIWLQIGLQLFACLIWYLAVRRIAGILPGMLLAGAMMFLPSEVLRGLNYGPDMLYLCVFGLGLLCVAGFLAREEQEKPEIVSGILLSVFYGIFVGLACYMDISGAILLILTAGVIGIQGRQDGKYLSRRFLWLAVVLIIAIGMFAGILLIDAYCSNNGFAETFITWCMLYQPQGIEWFFWLDAEHPMWMSVALWALLFGGVGAVVRRDGQRAVLWILATVLPVTVQVLSMQQLQGFSGGLLLYIGMILTGIACVDIWLAIQKRNKKEPIVEIIEAIHEEVEKQERTEFIQNPLPLPKKHIRRNMDFSVIPAEDMMHFDIETDENDDFDH